MSSAATFSETASAFRVYFAGSIRGGRQDASIYKSIVNIISDSGNKNLNSSPPRSMQEFNHVKVLTEHVADPHLNDTGEPGIESSIYDRDMQWLLSSHGKDL